MAEPSLITSRQNPQVKEAVRLRDGKERRRQQRFIVDGAREVLRALKSGIRPLKAFVCDELCKSTESLAARDAVADSKSELLQVAPEVYGKLAFGDRDDGIIVVAETPQNSLGRLDLPANPLVAVLEGIE